MNDWLLFVFVAGFIGAIAYAVTAIVTGKGGRRLRSRLEALSDADETAESISAIRARYLRQLSPFERTMEELPGMEWLRKVIDQAGWSILSYRFAALGIALFLAGVVALVLLH